MTQSEHVRRIVTHLSNDLNINDRIKLEISILRYMIDNRVVLVDSIDKVLK